VVYRELVIFSEKRAATLELEYSHLEGKFGKSMNKNLAKIGEFRCKI
jgi:hypothetical protein